MTPEELRALWDDGQIIRLDYMVRVFANATPDTLVAWLDSCPADVRVKVVEYIRGLATCKPEDIIVIDAAPHEKDSLFEEDHQYPIEKRRRTVERAQALAAVLP